MNKPEFYMAHESTGSFYWIEDGVNLHCPMNVDGSPNWDGWGEVDLEELDPVMRNEVAAVLSGVYNTMDQVWHQRRSVLLKQKIRQHLPY